MKSQITSLAAIVAIVSACGGEDAPAQPYSPAPTTPTTPAPNPTPPTQAPQGTPAAEKFFVEQVYPSIQATCGTCHIGGRAGAPPWLGENANDAYDLIKEYKGGLLVGPINANLLLLKEPHAGGQQLSGQQKGLVQQWLALEYDGETGGAPTATFSQALENFANCMNFNDWDGRDLDQIPLQPVAVDGVTVANANCETCHLDEDKAGGVRLNSADAQGTFATFQVFPGILKLVTAAGFPFQQLIASERLINKGTEYENCVVNQALLDLVNEGDLNDDAYCHPTYVVDRAVEDNLEFFVENNIAIANNGNCANQGQ